MNVDHYVLDLRPKAGESKPLDADMIIEIDLISDEHGSPPRPSGYLIRYVVAGNVVEEGRGVGRPEMITLHVKQIREHKPASVVIRTGAHSTGHIKDIALESGVIKSIIEGKLDVQHLLPHS